MRITALLAALWMGRLLERFRSGRPPAGRRLEESEQRFKLFVESVQDYGIFMLDPLGRIASWNKGAERIKGYAEEEALGRHFSLFYTERDRAQKRPDAELVVARRDGRYQEEGWRVRKDGGWFWASVTITAIRNEEGRLVGFGKVTRDLTERKKGEEELRRAKEAAEVASQAKSDFLAAVSHELRTPLNAIVGYADLMDGGIGGTLGSDHKRHLERIRAASDHLRLQIDQILSLARIEAGHEELRLETVDPNELARAAVSFVARTAEQKGLTTSVEAAAVGAKVRTDPEKARQILLNLLSNAEKFTAAGEIGIRVLADGPGNVQFHVWDTGIGVAEEDRQRIFDRFTQADQSATRQQGGTGLGLSISRQLAHLLGGEITLQSTPGAGSTFTLRLPAEGPDSEADS
jgi:PAS domain S-box-containing protein